jgi:transposase
MKRKRHSPAQIARNLREVEADLAEGLSLPRISEKFGVSEQTVQRWLQDYGSSKEGPAARTKKLGTENRRLRRTIARLQQDKRILTEAVQGNF